MAGALVHQVKLASSCSLTRNCESKRCVKRQNSIRMACTLQTPQLGMTGFSGLRGCNALDNVEKSGQTLHSKVATVTSIGRRKGTRIAPKAMFHRYTEKSIKVIMLTQEEARRVGHNFVGTEQILLALISEGSGVASKVLKSMGINLKDARAEVDKIIGRGSGMIAVEIPFTPRAKRVLELSLEEARQLGHSYIGTEHLLLGLLREGEGVAARVLENLGADPTIIRTQVIRIVGGSAEAVGASVGGGGSSGNKMPTLEDYGTNLTKLAEEGKLNPVVGMEDDLEYVIEILSHGSKFSPCLIGEPGVRRTAIAEGLAQRIADGDVPETLKGKKVITLNVGLLVACMSYQREFGERLKKLVEQIKRSGDVILFIDDVTDDVTIFFDKVNTITGARDELECVVATTLDGYKKLVEKDPLSERFVPVEVSKSSVDEAIQTSKGLRDRNEIGQKLCYSEESLVAAAEFAFQCISRFLPVKAIDSIDEGGSRLRPHHLQIPKEAQALEEELGQIIKEKYEAVKGQDFLKAAELKNREKDLKVQISALMEKNKQDSSKAESEFEDGGAWVTESDIQHIVSSWNRIPAEKVSTDESGRLLKIEESLRMLTTCVKILFELMDVPLACVDP